MTQLRHDALPAGWICCHLGAREHYVVPRALHGVQRLAAMITDAWVPPGSAWSRLPGVATRRLRGRWHADLAHATIRHFTPAVMAHEVWWRTQPDGWIRLMKRNAWFGGRAASALAALPPGNAALRVVFAHSYSALDVFRVAKSRGWMTVLGQIDPGPEHFAIARRAAGDYGDFGPPPQEPPPAYFDAWRAECGLADRIVVNSQWSRVLLERAGVPAAKLHIMPLIYTPAQSEAPCERRYPSEFTAERPLRLLFVGQASVIKGAAALLEAMDLLGDVPVELRMVGATAMRVPGRFTSHRAIRWTGPVSRSEVMRHYRDNDVLVFPSLSDGFGMAQIEAQGQHLPILASRSCGQVVDDNVNGLLLDDHSPRTIAAAIRRLLDDPLLLSRFSLAAASHQPRLFELAAALVQLEPS